MPEKFRKYIGWGLIGILLLWVLFNFHKVDISFFITDVRVPASLLILLSAAMGAGSVFALQYIRKFRREDPPKE